MESPDILAWGLRIIGWLALGLLAWQGRAADRIGVLAFLIAWYASPMLSHLEFGNVRWAVALLGIGLFASLFTLAMVADRWWLLVAAGVQGVAVLSYAAALLMPESLMWSGVTVRRAVWFQLMIICLFGAWECHQRRTLAREGRSHEHSLVPTSL